MNRLKIFVRDVVIIDERVAIILSKFLSLYYLKPAQNYLGG